MARPKSPQRRWAALVLLAVATLATAQDATQDMVTDYAPTTGVTCPDAPLLRVFNPLNQSLHPSEKEYITSRESTVLPNAWRDWIGDGSAIGYNASMFAGNWSRVGIAASGGGYRAAQYGAGVLSAFDARDESAKNAGSGGLLQVTSYISGLSGKPHTPLLRVLIQGLKVELQGARGCLVP
jgi:lysophospholipase